ncbi:flagellar motor protein MotB [Oceanobacillus piezotolerans]|uniref:Flagellar motor protein MotB n=1 Tax=Oceanobacillus piezotolerans TaxID=2448030 RepID=A0A498DB66_9BACI|nr:flagellar motor protein MotB [Oceanobacillus piezotolerans]RLL46934.1 flagellar motor protein MotB [Oceanobacillus piezotolerans]
MRRNKKKKKSHIDESWLLPYSDMLTLLVALFIVLFAMSDINSQKYEELSNVFRSEFGTGGNSILEQNPSPVESPPAEEENEEKEEELEENEETNKEQQQNSVKELNNLKQIQSNINGYISKENLTEQLDTELTEEGLMVRIVNDVFFDMGSAEVKQEGAEIAREVSNLLVTDPPHQIVVSGHADDVPISNSEYSSNWELSVNRALNFMALVLENKNLNPIHFSAKGYGEYKPLEPNTSEENRAKNRRVEVLIMPHYEIHLEEQ